MQPHHTILGHADFAPQIVLQPSWICQIILHKFNLLHYVTVHSILAHSHSRARTHCRRSQTSTTPKRYGPRFVCVPFPPYMHAIHFIAMCANKYPSIQPQRCAVCMDRFGDKLLTQHTHTRRLRTQTKRLRTSPLHTDHRPFDCSLTLHTCFSFVYALARTRL